MTIPAKNAPKAKLTPKKVELAQAIPNAMARTDRRNSSRTPVWAT